MAKPAMYPKRGSLMETADGLRQDSVAARRMVYEKGRYAMRMSAKKRWMAFLSVCLMAVSALACANSWGLRGGKILDAVMRTHRWDDYAVCGETEPDAAVMGNKYHRVLMLADEGWWFVQK